MIYRLTLLLFLLLLSFALMAESDPDAFAKRGKGVVTHEEFDAWMTRIPENERAEFLRDGDRLRQVLSQLLTSAQIAADAQEAGFDQDAMIRIRIRMAAEQELAKAWTEHVVESASDPDWEMLAYESYLLSPGEFMTNRSIDVTHLLVSNENRTEEEALELADQLHGQAVGDPSAFEELISRHSEDPSSATNHGKYERVEQGDMVKPFEDRAFSLQIGEFSEPVKTEYGFHIIRLDAVYKSELKPFDSVKNNLITKERANHKKRVRLDYLNQIGSLPTEIPEEELKEMLSRYFDPEDLATPGDAESE